MTDRIALQNISVSFSTHRVLENFSCEIPLFGATALFGRSGAGKTTLLRLLLRFVKPDRGVLTGLDGLRFSTVFQEDRLLPWATALENVSLAANQAEAKKRLLQLGLSDAESLLPKALSGGMARRVAIARALAYAGDMLLLDEPFTGLDEERKRLAADVILAERKPILLVTHDENEAALLGARAFIRL